jgi:hypothetical protein
MFSDCDSIQSPCCQGAHRGFRGAVYRSSGGECFDPENRSDVDDVTDLLFLHSRQGGGNSVQNSLDVDVNLPIPFLHFEKVYWRDGHNTRVVHPDIDPA